MVRPTCTPSPSVRPVAPPNGARSVVPIVGVPSTRTAESLARGSEALGKGSRVGFVRTEPAVPCALPTGEKECGERCGDAASSLSKKEDRGVTRMGTRRTLRYPIELTTGTEHTAMGSAAT